MVIEMKDSTTLDRELSEIAKRANDRIQTEGQRWHGAEYRARAEMIAEQEVPSSWEWQVREYFGALPQIVLLRYDPREDG